MKKKVREFGSSMETNTPVENSQGSYLPRSTESGLWAEGLFCNNVAWVERLYPDFNGHCIKLKRLITNSRFFVSLWTT